MFEEVKNKTAIITGITGDFAPSKVIYSVTVSGVPLPVQERRFCLYILQTSDIV
jgi:hypothetical protein